MKKVIILLLFKLLFSIEICAENKDTLKVYNTNKIEITSNKETNPIGYIPCSETTFDINKINNEQLSNIRSLSISAANLFIPDYGSKMSNAVYIRGIGSRNSGQSVGVYIDNIPIADRCAINFDFLDINKIEVLRGAQSTLYGRNAMSGIINMQTISPLNFQGTLIDISGGTYGEAIAKISHYALFNNNFGMAVAGYYNRGDGFFRNTTTGERADNYYNFGGRIKFDAIIFNNIISSTNISFDNSNQNSFPYMFYDANKTGEEVSEHLNSVAMNDSSNYKQNTISFSQSFIKNYDNFTLSSNTGYTNYYDKMLLDQDFTAEPIFTLMQAQKRNTITEEIVFMFNNNSHIKWNIGAFGFYDWLNTDAKVLFKNDGIAKLIESNVVNNVPDYVYYDILDTEFPINNIFKNRTFGSALYCQITDKNFIWEKITTTAGLRFDYEGNSLDYNTTAALTQFYNANHQYGQIQDTLTEKLNFNGENHKNNFQVLPKLAMNYNANDNMRFYASVARGYKSGGYNLQMLSDLSQNDLRADMVKDLKNSIYTKLTDMGMPASLVEQLILSKIPDFKKIDTAPNVIGNMLWYEPEYCWNYELGMNFTFLNNKINGTISTFMINVDNIQLTKFSPNGFGRMLSNAGRVNSNGFEIILNAININNFNFGIEYGFANSKFKDYKDTIEINEENKEIDYSGKRVPYAPQQTLSIFANYNYDFTNFIIDNISITLQYLGAGDIYWNEQNDLKQNFYNTLNGKIGFGIGKFNIELWAKNILNSDYQTFYFETLGNNFFQQCKPFHFGISAKIKI